MNQRKLIAGALTGALLAWLIAPQLYSEFRSVRKKVVRTAIESSGTEIRVPIPAETALEDLRSPFAAIGRIRNGTTGSLNVRLTMDGQELCAEAIPAGASRRLDCAVRGTWSGREDHVIVFSADASPFTVEYFELATHYGSLSIGPRNLIVVAKGFVGFGPSSLWYVLAIFVMLTLSAWSVRDPSLPRALSVIHLTLAGILAFIILAVIVSRFVSPYALVISDTFLLKLLLFTAAPRLLAWARTLIQKYPTGWLVAKMVGLGLLVGMVFWSFAARRIVELHEGNISGSLVLSHHFFDQSPMAGNPELERTLVFNDGNGYDGQFFYYMVFDPFLSTFRHEPKRYEAFIDMPPYRYGRIGFSLLAKLFSGDLPTRYPGTMVALVIAALGLCTTLLAAIAHHHGRSLLWGVLVLFIPGFWQSVEWTLPEPLAAAFMLGAYLCLQKRQWWACGALLGACLLVRETSGVFALAIAGGVLLDRRGPLHPAYLTERRRDSAIVALLAFLPIVLWKGFVGSVFWSTFGMDGVLPHPNDLGLPFAGIRDLWTTIARGEYFQGWPNMAHAGHLFPVLTTAGAVLALAATVKRLTPIAVAALFYGTLTILFNYESVWLDIGNAQRLSIDLFVALVIVFLQLPPTHRALRVASLAFWGATTWYVLYGTFNAVYYRDAVFGLVF